MLHTPQTAGFAARLLMLARETFEASVAIHYYAPWASPDKATRAVDRKRTGQLPV